MEDITARDQFVLLLIGRTGINNIFKLILRFDRADFPNNVRKNLDILLDRNLIYPTKFHENGHATHWGVTDTGETFIKNNISKEDMIDHVKEMKNPDFLLELTNLIFDNK